MFKGNTTIFYSPKYFSSAASLKVTSFGKPYFKNFDLYLTKESSSWRTIYKFMLYVIHNVQHGEGLLTHITIYNSIKIFFDNCTSSDQSVSSQRTLSFCENKKVPKWSKTYLVSLREMCPNTELFLVRIFLYSDWIRRFTCKSLYWVWIQENTDQK